METVGQDRVGINTGTLFRGEDERGSCALATFAPTRLLLLCLCVIFDRISARPLYAGVIRTARPAPREDPDGSITVALESLLCRLMPRLFHSLPQRREKER